MDQSARKTFTRFLEQARRLATQFGPLYHERLLGWSTGRKVSAVEWQAFQTANQQSDLWESWDRTSDNEWLGRFWGDPKGLESWTKLAESLYLTVCCIDDSWSLPESHHGWLNVLYELAEDYPTPEVRRSLRVWGCDPQPDSETLEQTCATWSDGKPAYPLHPLCESLSNDLFSVTIAAVDLLLRPNQVILLPVYHSGEIAVELETEMASLRPSTDEIETPDHDDSRPYLFRRVLEEDTERWHVRFSTEEDVEESTTVPPKRGMFFVFLLLQNSRHIDSQSMEAAVGKKSIGVAIDQQEAQEEVASARSTRDDTQYALGGISKAMLEKMIEKQEVDIERCEDDDKRTILENELDVLKQHRTQFGKGGKPRRAFTDIERKRSTERVNRNLLTCYETLAAKGLTRLAAHLKKHITRQNFGFQYNPPDPPIEWRL